MSYVRDRTPSRMRFRNARLHSEQSQISTPLQSTGFELPALLPSKLLLAKNPLGAASAGARKKAPRDAGPFMCAYGGFFVG